MNILVTVQTKPHHRAWLESAAPGERFIYKEGAAPGAQSSDKEDGVTRADIENADILLGNVSPALLSPADKLRWMQTASAGVDGYLNGCLPKDAVLTNATGAYGLAISEYMLAVWLELMKKLHRYRDRQSESDWHDLGPVTSVWGSTVLVLGLGNIGGEFAKRAKALGAKVIGVRRAGTEKPDYVDELIHTEKLDDYLPQADCVAITLPGTKQTKGMFDAARIAKMKDGAVLLNVGRGTIVDTDALCAALQSGKLSGAGLDVTDPEPLPADHPLWKQENAVITPHVSGGFHLAETHDRIIRIMAENLTAFLAGRPLKNVVDFETGYRKL